MANQPVLTIPVDTSQFDAFLNKWNQYHAEVQQHSNHWANITAQISAATSAFAGLRATTQGTQQAATAAAQQMAAMANAAHQTAQYTAQINQNLTNQRAVNASNQQARNTQNNARNWQSINKSVASTSRWMAAISRMSIISGAFKLGTAGVKGAVAGYTTAALAYNNLANVNKDSRRLGMKPGQIQAFEDVYGPAGGSRDLLAKMAEAKNDKNVAQQLSPLGITQDMVQAMDPEKLAAEFLKRIGTSFSKMGDQAIPWAQSMGLTNFMQTQDMRLAKSYAEQPGAFDDLSQQYEATYKRVKVEQDAADAATEFVKAFKTAKDSLENNFAAALKPLAKPVTDFTLAVADWVKWASGLEGTKETIKEFGSALDKVTRFINSHGSIWDSGKITHDPKKPFLTTGGSDKPWSISQWWHDFKAGFGGNSAKDDKTIQAQNGAKVDKGDLQAGENGQLIKVANRSAFFRALEDQQNLPAGMMQGIENIESHGADPSQLVGPKTKYGRAIGPFQMLKGTAARFGVSNRFDEANSAGGAALYLKFLRQHYGGDSAKAAAAYNWGEGNLDKMLANPSNASNWRDHLPEQTRDYLNKLEVQGVDLSVTQNFNRAKGDKKLPQSGPQLDPDQFQIVDLSQEGKGGKIDQKQMSDAVEMGVVSGMSKFMAFFKEGGGSAMRETGNSRAARTSNGHVAQGPVKVNVQVNTPPGTSTNVTMGGLPR